MAFSFGAPAAAPSAASSFSFGAAASTSQPAAAAPAFSFGAPKPAGGGFGFGASTSTAAPAASAPAFGFGAPAAAAAPATSAPFSFGAPAAAPASAGGGFNFGQPAQQPQAQPQQQQQQLSFAAPPPNPLSRFGASTSTTPTPAAGGLFGSVGGQAATDPNASGPVDKSTRFEQLPEALRKDLHEFEQFIQGRVAVYDDLRAKTMGEDIARSHHLIADLDTELTSLRTTLTQTHRTAMSLRTRMDASNADQAKYTALVKARKEAKSTSSSSDSAKSLANFPFEYFSKRVDAMTQQLSSYRAATDQIRSQLAHHDPDQVKAILPTLRHQHQLTVALASKIAGLHAEMAELEAQYLLLWREKTGSVRDPFAERRSATSAAAGHDGMNAG